MRSLVTALMTWVVLMVLPSMAVGATNSGILILNQASASYFDTNLGINSSITSNFSSIRVLPIARFTLEQDNQRNAQPGQRVTFPHRLTNTGNVSDSYLLEVEQLLGGDFNLINPLVVHDLNDNGQADKGEPVMNQTPELEPGEGINLLVTGTVPTAQAVGSTTSLQLEATSQYNPAESQANLDQVVVIGGAGGVTALVFSKQSSELCSTPVAPNQTLEYTLTLNNTGTNPPQSQIIEINGVPVTGVLLQDSIPANTRLLNILPTAVPAAGRPLVQLYPSNRWIDFDQWNGSDVVRAVAVMFATGTPASGQQVQFEFSVAVTDSVTAGARINNIGFIDTDQNGSPEVVTNRVCNTVAEEGVASASIRFIQPVLSVRQECTQDPNGCAGPSHADDSTFEDAAVYRLDSNPDYIFTRDAVYIEIQSSSLNAFAYDNDVQRVDPDDPNSAALINATLRSAQTGDFIQVTFIETSSNSGLFRSLRPVRLSATNRGNGAICPGNLDNVPDYTAASSAHPNCVLGSGSNDRLLVEIVDADNNRTRLSDEAVVDPLGVVFDSLSLQPVEGATVRLCRVPQAPEAPLDTSADPTAQCEQAENPDAPGTPLPIQVTGADGRYQYDRVFPGCYFVDVSVEGIDNNSDSEDDYSFPSQVPDYSFAGVREVNDHSYGRDGFAASPPVEECGGVAGAFLLSAGDPPLIADIPIDPDAATAGADGIVLTKEVSTARAAIGDVVQYTLTATNGADNVLVNAQITDDLPFGFKYELQSVRYDGVAVEDPSGAPGPQLIFPLGNMQPGAAIEVAYVLQLTSGARNSKGVNTAQMQGGLAGGALPVTSNIATAQVKVEEDPLLSSDAYVFGKVFVDADCDDIQSDKEWSVAGVRLYMEDGTWVVTDEDGNYSIYGLKPGLHVLKLDTTTLPPTSELKPLDNRHGAAPSSRFVDLIAGDFHRADFATQCVCKDWPALENELQRRRENLRGDWALQWAEQYRPIDQERDTQTGRSQDLSRRQQAKPDGDISSGQAWGPDAQLPNSSRRSGGFGVISPIAVGSTDQRLPAGRVALAADLRGELPEELRVPVVAAVAPDPEVAAKTITAEQARAGSWLWPLAETDVSRDGRFIAVVRAGVGPVLLVNGRAVSPSKLGAQVLNRSERAQVVAWYGVELKEGSNTLAVVGDDSFGNKRILTQRVVNKPGAAATISVKPRSRFLDADGGKSYVGVDVAILDRRGVPASGVYFITAETGDGRWLNPDVQDAEPGTQIRVENGQATLWLQSSYTPGNVKLRVSEIGSDLSKDASIAFIAPMRPLIAAGLVDITGHFRDVSGNNILPAGDEFEDGFELESRAAVFLKGKVKGDVLLTLSYDSAKQDESPLFRDIDPNAYYPIYGDASIKGYDAQSRDKLYVRVERGSNSAMWGDYLTDADVDQSLGATRRSLTGANVHLENERYELQLFGAESGSIRQLEEIRGNGTATDYRLAVFPIEPNSEVIEIIERDRDNTGLIVSTQRLNRFGDYNLNPDEGFLSLSRPLASQDPATGNPLSIRITYDSVETSADDMVAGIRAKVNLTENLSVRAGYTVDDAPTTGSNLGSVDVRWDLGNQHELIAEVAAMDHQDGSESGTAERIRLRSQWAGRLETNAEYARAEKGFTNRDASVAAGRQELRADVTLAVTPSLDVGAEVLQSKSLTTADERTQAEVSLAKRISGWQAELGFRETEQNQGGVEDSFTSIRGRLERAFSFLRKDGTAHIELAQDLDNSDRREVEFGASYQIHDKARIYGRHEVINSLTGFTNLAGGVERSNTVFGVETDYIASTQAYSEMRQRGGLDGRSIETANGIRGAFELKPGLTLSPAFEWIDTRTGPDDSDQVALSLGLADTRNPHRKFNLRADTRFAELSDYYGLNASLVQRLNLDWSGILRVEGQVETPQDAERRTRATATMGVSRRPKETNIWHMVGLLQLKLDENFDTDRRETLIASTHQNIRVTDDLVVSGQLAGKWQETVFGDQSFNTNVQLAGMRWLWDINRRFDLDVHAGVLGTDGFQSQNYALGLGVNYLLARSFRVGLGYNFYGFKDTDLDDQGVYSRGVYFGLQLKFDEASLGWLTPAE